MWVFTLDVYNNYLALAGDTWDRSLTTMSPSEN